MVTERKSKKQEEEDTEVGIFHSLDEKLQDSLILVSKKKAKASHDDYRNRLKKQIEYKASLKDKSKKKKYKKAADIYKSATFLLQQYHSPCCWKT